MTNLSPLRSVALLTALFHLACAGGDDGSSNDGGTGGLGTGGSPGTGGDVGTGGVPGTGGVGDTGGGPGVGGSGGDPVGTGGTGGDGSGGGDPGGDLPKFVGNITTTYSHDVDYGGKVFADHWDQITPENAGKWGSVQSSTTSPFNWSALDAIYDYAESKGIIFKQHAFVWGSQQPSGPAPTAQQVETWIQTFCERYPNTKLIDVVNEPPPHTEPNYVDALGGGTNGDWAWITKSFELARKHCPNAVLILNDYNNIEWDNDNAHFIDIVKTIMANGAEIDAIGAQAHDLDHASVSTDKMKTLIAKLHDETGLPIYITEYDISSADDATQLSLYQQHVPFFLETDYIKGITIWGWFYGQTWNLAPDSGLVRQDGSPRPAMTWLMETLGRPIP